jgi:hypothetical protein
MWLQNAFWVYVPLLVLLGIACFVWLRSVPVRVSFRDQLDIFKNKHTWFCTLTYIMTFGSFSGFSAAFPLLIKSVYGKFDGAPDPLAYAFYGPLIGSASRVIFGFVADKVGGAILTTITGVALIGLCTTLVLTGSLTPTSLESFPLFVGIMLAIFFFTGVGNAATFRQYPLIFSHSPRRSTRGRRRGRRVRPVHRVHADRRGPRKLLEVGEPVLRRRDCVLRDRDRRQLVVLHAQGRGEAVLRCVSRDPSRSAARSSCSARRPCSARRTRGSPGTSRGTARRNRSRTPTASTPGNSRSTAATATSRRRRAVTRGSLPPRSA